MPERCLSKAIVKSLFLNVIDMKRLDGLSACKYDRDKKMDRNLVLWNSY